MMPAGSRGLPRHPPIDPYVLETKRVFCACLLQAKWHMPLPYVSTHHESCIARHTLHLGWGSWNWNLRPPIDPHAWPWAAYGGWPAVEHTAMLSSHNCMHAGLYCCAVWYGTPMYVRAVLPYYYSYHAWCMRERQTNRRRDRGVWNECIHHTRTLLVTTPRLSFFLLERLSLCIDETTPLPKAPRSTIICLLLK